MVLSVPYIINWNNEHNNELSWWKGKHLQELKALKSCLHWTAFSGINMTWMNPHRRKHKCTSSLVEALHQNCSFVVEEAVTRTTLISVPINVLWISFHYFFHPVLFRFCPSDVAVTVNHLDSINHYNANKLWPRSVSEQSSVEKYHGVSHCRRNTFNIKVCILFVWLYYFSFLWEAHRDIYNVLPYFLFGHILNLFTAV